MVGESFAGGYTAGVMSKRLNTILGAVSLGLLQACVSAETTCTDGIPAMREKVAAVVGYTEHPDVNEYMAQARQQLHRARQAFAEAQFEECVIGLEQAQILLDKAQRRRRELAA